MGQGGGSASGSSRGARDYAGPERRQLDIPDRRRTRRGGRRATDTFAKAAKFVYQLLTEPPRS